MIRQMPSTFDRPFRPPRRTQAQRREATRTALLEATIECLVDHGYANTTTARVADLAGVSRGAQVHYFPNRAALVAAAVGHLAQRRIEEFQTRLLAVPTGPGRIKALLDELWDAHQGELFDATLELWVAARTDPELHADLIGLERNVTHAIWTLSAQLLDDQHDRLGFRDDLDFALSTVRGLALLRIASGDNSRAVTHRWHAARERLTRILS
jgi:AcrR family transcriptional regulator